MDEKDEEDNGSDGRAGRENQAESGDKGGREQGFVVSPGGPSTPFEHPREKTSSPGHDLLYPQLSER